MSRRTHTVFYSIFTLSLFCHLLWFGLPFFFLPSSSPAAIDKIVLEKTWAANAFDIYISLLTHTSHVCAGCSSFSSLRGQNQSMWYALSLRLYIYWHESLHIIGCTITICIESSDDDRGAMRTIGDGEKNVYNDIDCCCCRAIVNASAARRAPLPLLAD